MSGVWIQLLGGAVIRSADEVVTGSAAQRHRVALLAVLVMAGDSGVSREKLVGLLWPESDDARARNLLNQSVHALRRALASDVILSVGDNLRLNAERVSSDVASFEAAVAARDLERASEQYTGPFLDGFYLPGGKEFEHWVDDRRRRLKNTYRKVLETQAEAAESSGNAEDAVRLWRRLAAQERYDSEVILRLMRALEAAGRRGEAIEQAEIHVALLREELGAEPDPSVLALTERMRREPIRDRAFVPADSRQRREADPGGRAGAPERAAAVRTARAAWRAPAVIFIGVLCLTALLYLIRPSGAGGPETGTAALPTGPAARGARLVAVLPLEPLTGSPDDSAFAEGMHRDLITTLSKLGGIAVISRASVIPYGDRAVPMHQIAEELGADVVVEGEVRRVEDRVRVDVRLTEVASGRVLWGEIYDRELTVRNIFAIQTEITERIVAALDVALTPLERERITSAPTHNLTAYQYYHQATRMPVSRAGNIEAARLLRLALDIDPDYAAAWAELAIKYGWRSPWIGFPPAASDSALVFAKRALEIDPNEALAYTALAVAYGHKGLLNQEEKAARKALQLDPNDALALRRLAESYLDRGRYVEAFRLHREVLRLSPNHPTRRGTIGVIYQDLGDYGTAREWFESVIKLYPRYWIAREGLAFLDLMQGRPDSAVLRARRTVDLNPAEPGAKASAGLIDLYARDYPEAERHLSRLMEQYPGVPVLARYLVHASTVFGFTRLQAGDTLRAEALFGETQAFVEGLLEEGATASRLPFEMAMVEAARGKADDALDWLEKAYRAGFRRPWFLEHIPMADAMRDDPRFKDLLARMKDDVQEMRSEIER